MSSNNILSEDKGTEYAVFVYIIFFVVVNFTGLTFLSESVWAPYLETSSTSAPDGSAWTADESIHWAYGGTEYFFNPTPSRVGAKAVYHMDEGSGSTIYDDSGNNEDGTINGATWINGKFGDALGFDGNDDYVEIPAHEGALNFEEKRLRTDFTISMWFKTTDSDAGLFNIQGGNDPDNTDGHDRHIYLDDGDVCVRIFNSDGSNGNPCVSGNFADGNWHHVTFRPVEDDATYVFVDGTNNVASDSDAAVSDFTGSEGGWSNLYAMLGKSEDAANTYGNSDIDEVRIYDHALSNEEIKRLYEGVGSYSGGPSGSWWIKSGEIRWLDENQRKRAAGGQLVDTDTGGSPGSTWIDSRDGLLHYIDAEGDHRKMLDRKALGFDGSGDVVSIPNNSELQITGDLTITYWMKPKEMQAQRENPIDKAYGGEFAMTLETDSDGRLNTYFGSAGDRTTPYARNTWTNIVNNDEWVHIAWVRDNSAQDVTLYVDGEDWSDHQTNSEWESPSTSSYDVTIGNGYTNSLNGMMDDVRIYNQVKSESEVQSIMETKSMGDDAGLVGYWPLDEGSGTVAGDKTGSGHDGDISGATWLELSK